jgi:cytidylate kinase
MKKVITIDGPSASGKGTLAILLAEKLGWDILDSGALYRAFAFFSLKELDENIIAENLKNITFKIIDKKIEVLFKNNDISNYLRNEKTAIQASKISSLQKTREILLPIQRAFLDNNNLVADGRDMGSVVFPDAALKFFLDATPEIRAKRRYLELQKRGQEVNIHHLIKDITERDEKDKMRKLSPLTKTDDTILLDSTNLTQNSMLNEALKSIIESKII